VTSDRGIVKNVYWKQAEPRPDTSGYSGPSFWTLSDTKNRYVFDGITTTDLETGYMWSEYAFYKLRMSTFNFFRHTDIFRVIVKAENSRTN